MNCTALAVALGLAGLGGLTAQTTTAPSIVIWHGDTQRTGHLGDLQDDFNLMGHVEPWRDLDRLTYSVNGAAATPLAFRAFRRLVSDGDFNADIPIGQLRMGANTVTIEALYRDGQTLRKVVTVVRENGATRLPVRIRWAALKSFDEVGQAVDGEWRLTRDGLRTAQVGYDRVFLIGQRDWQDYEVHTSVTIHSVPNETSPLSGGNGLGIILRFAGHVAGGPRHFGSGQPKWGYQPFGAIGWLRWTHRKVAEGPHVQFYPGDTDRWENQQRFPVAVGETYSMRFACQTLPDAADGSGVTRYRFRVWPQGDAEPAVWTWERVQTSRHALRRGGFALLAHHVDATFGDVTATGMPPAKQGPGSGPAAAMAVTTR